MENLKGTWKITAVLKEKNHKKENSVDMRKALSKQSYDVRAEKPRKPQNREADKMHVLKLAPEWKVDVTSDYRESFGAQSYN